MIELHKIVNEDNTVAYLASHDIKINKRRKSILMSCIFCNGIAVHFIPNSGAKMYCPTCGKYYNLIDVAKKFSGEDKTDDEIISELAEEFDTPILVDGELDALFSFYSNLGFDLVPLSSSRGDGKAPIEEDWPNIEHKDISHWKDWVLNKGLNIGVKAGERSNIIIVDIDTEEVPDVFKNVNTLIQKTNRGWQYYFKYDTDIPNLNLQPKGHEIQILTDGKQGVVPPSIVHNIKRKWFSDDNVIALPSECKEWILSFKPKQVVEEEQFVTATHAPADMPSPIETVKLGDGGGRNNMLIHIGGILKSDLSVKQCAKVIDLINSKFFAPPLPEKEMTALKKSLDKYIAYDETDLASKLYNHLKIVEFGNAKELAESLSERKDLVEKALSFLMVNEMIYKRGRNYCLIPKIQWKTQLLDLSNPIDFNVKFFSKLNYFNFGDMVVLGLKTGTGKTTISSNLIKDITDQGKSVDYFCNEPGGRFAKILLKLGVKENDFRYAEFCDPEEIVLDKNSISIIDWLLPTDYAATDKLFKKFNRQLLDKGGFLIVFMQLKEEGYWYSKEMVKFFATVAARYFNDENTKETGYWVVDKMRERKINIPDGYKIPCIYNFDTKELNEIKPEDISGDSNALQNTQYSL